jgi:DNA polymerase-3 subunit gamma/tau
MARALNCTSLEIIPCNTCKNCINIQLGRSFNFQGIKAAKNTKINSIPKMLEMIQLAPRISKYKVCLIDEADMLNNNAFNKLLKTFNSPPINTVFILSTTIINKIPDNLISKCQTIYFHPIKKQDLIIAINKVINSSEKLKITNKGITNLLNISNRSLRDAFNTIKLFSIEKRILRNTL